MKRISIVLFCILTCLTTCDNIAFSNEPAFPILRESTKFVNFSTPNAQREEKYIDFLSASVKIQNGFSCGSGTICYYDENSKWAYVISCGHLWEGNKKYNPQKSEIVKIIVWYHNKNKLKEPKNYDAEVLFYSNDLGYDCSLLRFKPDWHPNYFKISNNFNYKKGSILNSLGCDGGSEVARYEVEIIKLENLDIITQKNSPRPGRSGGGLLNEKELVGVCWGTSDVDGSGIGYFTSLKSIEVVFSKNNHEWLLNIRNKNDIMIYDWQNPNNKYENNYIPIPILFF